MNSPFDGPRPDRATQQAIMKRLLADFQRARTDALRMRDRLATATATATSDDGLVTATVTASGEVSGLKFNGTAYRRMAPAELSQAILGSIKAARSGVTAQFRDVMAAVPDLATLIPEDPMAALNKLITGRSTVDDDEEY